MTIVQDRLTGARPHTPVDPKKNAINNNKDLDVEVKKEEAGYFGSFFGIAKGTQRKKAPMMEAPPAIIKPQAALSERETMETEVISE